MMKIRVQCEGRTPLMMDPMPDDVLESLRTKTSLQIKRDKKREDEAGGKLYTKGGIVGFPPENVLACLVEAGTLVKYQGMKMMSNSSESLVPGFVEIVDPWVELKHEGWVPDVRRGRNPKTEEGIAINRPRFDKWGFTVTIRVDDDRVDESRIRELFDNAGAFKRLGAHRKKGGFGRFAVVGWEILEGGKKKAKKPEEK